METYMPGTRVRVFNWRLFANDRKTPLSVTMQAATVLRWYGRVRTRVAGLDLGPYPSLIDVRFDDGGKESCGHFADPVYVERL